MTDPFAWHDGERLIRFGGGLSDQASALLEQRGFDGYALLTTARWHERAAPLADRAVVVVDVPLGTVPDAAAAIRAEVGRRPVVALGGGRVVDVAKALAGAGGGACAALPTTLSGAEMTGFHRLPAGVEGGSMVRPSLVVADPELMASQPLPGLVASALNGLAHAVEALYVPLANPVATFAALRAAELFAAGLAARDPVADDLSLAALLAGYASGQTGFAVHHIVSQTLVRVGGTPHAETNGVMLPHTVAMMVERAPEPIGALAQVLGGGLEPAAAPALIEGLAERAELRGLRALGFDPAAIDAVVDQVMARPDLANTPLPPDAAEIRALIEAAL